MQSTVSTEATPLGSASASPGYLAAGALPGRRAEVWRQRLVNLTLVFSDLALAIFVFQAAFVLQSLWGNGPLLGVTIVGVVPTVVVWVGLRTLLGLYPGYGLGAVEELRRQTYAAFAALAIIATITVALQVGDLMSRLVFALVFLGLLLLAPLLRHLVKGRMMRAGLWGKPVVVMSSGEPGESVVTLLTREWGLWATNPSPSSVARSSRRGGGSRLPPMIQA